MKVFVSYSTEDRKTAARVYTDLTTAGADVFQYGRSEKVGKPSWEQVLESITESDLFVVLISQSALRSGPVKAEVSHAHYSYINNDEKPDLLPAIIEAGADPFILIKRFATLDLVDYKPGIARLIQQLGLRKLPAKSLTIPLARVVLPDPNELFFEYKNKKPEPDPINTWSSLAETVIKNYELNKPPELPSEVEAQHLDQLLAGKPSKFNSLFKNTLSLPSAAKDKANDSKILTSKLLSLGGHFGILAAPVLESNPPIVQWNSIIGAIGYVLEESTLYDFHTASQVYVGPATEYTPAKSWFRSRHYRVKAKADAFLAESPWSNSVSFPVITSLGLPNSFSTGYVKLSLDDLVAPVLTLTLNKLSWSTVESAIEYILERSFLQSFADPSVSYKGPGTELIDPLASVGFSAYYRVRAKLANGSDGPWSNVVSSRPRLDFFRTEKGGSL